MSTEPTTASDGPLTGIRILDLTRVVMGPLATQVLADQGADVVVVEAAGGDTNRVMGPGPHRELSGISLNLMRNKRSVSIDLKSAEGAGFVRSLLATCDVVAATMRPSALERLGLSYAQVKELKPDIIYCQAQGFPQAGGRADEPAYDDIIQAATGASDVIERVTGSPGLFPTIVADKVCGLVMAQAITAALVHRERSGEGQHIEVPMVQAMAAFTLAEHGSGAIAEPPVADPGKPAPGYPRVLSPERRPHPTSDGLVHMLPYRREHYIALFRAAGVEEAETDPRYADQAATIRHSDSLYQDVRRICRTRTTREWLEFCHAAGIPATPVRTLQEMIDDLPLADHPAAGSYRVIPQMANFSRTSGGLRRPAPLIGEHTREVAGELGEEPV